MKIALLGDIAQFGKFSIVNNNSLNGYFEEIAKKLQDCDLVIGNLETPYVKDFKPYGSKSAHVSSEPKNVEILKLLNINYVNLSNNHIFDFGSSAYELTKKVLHENGINYFGIEGKQCFVNKNGIKVALSGYCSFNTNPQKITFNSSIGINGLDIEQVKKNMSANHENGYFNILSIHSGQEHVNFPSLDDINMARELSNIAPYIYYGHHPHVIQPVENYNKSLLAYSLGNFCFSDVYTNKSKSPLVELSENNKTGLILIVNLDERGLLKHECIPIYMGEEKMEFGKKEHVNLIHTYNDSLNLEPTKYNEMRSNLIANYLSSRKKMRNFNWYIKRMNFGSFKQIMNSKYNQYKYMKHVKNKLL